MGSFLRRKITLYGSVLLRVGQPGARIRGEGGGGDIREAQILRNWRVYVDWYEGQQLETIDDVCHATTISH